MNKICHIHHALHTDGSETGKRRAGKRVLTAVLFCCNSKNRHIFLSSLTMCSFLFAGGRGTNFCCCSGSLAAPWSVSATASWFLAVDCPLFHFCFSTFTIQSQIFIVVSLASNDLHRLDMHHPKQLDLLGGRFFALHAHKIGCIAPSLHLFQHWTREETSTHLLHSPDQETARCMQVPLTELTEMTQHETWVTTANIQYWPFSTDFSLRLLQTSHASCWCHDFAPCST